MANENMKKINFLSKEKISFKKKHIIGIIIILVAVLIAIFAGTGKKKGTAGDAAAQEYTVSRGSIHSTISGKATILPNDQYTVTALVSGDVLATYFEEGDVLQKDAVMYEIDSSDIAKSIESSNLSLERANNALSNINSSIADLTMQSPFSGIVKEVAVKVGDTVQNGQTLAKIYDDRSLILKIPFNESDANNIYRGQGATLTLVSDGSLLWGTVKTVYPASYVMQGNMRVKDVEITVENPGAVKANDKATAIIGNYACNARGTFSYAVDEVLKATASGKIVTLSLKENTEIQKGDVMAVLDGENLLTEKRNSELSLRESTINRDRTLDQLDNYTIKAPIDGTVVLKSVKAGDKLDNTKGAAELAIIYDLSSMKFDMEVDELDIQSVAVGQEVLITADAVKGKTYTGYVESININGTSTNGVTTYPVTVRIHEFTDLLPGMNVDAEIVIADAKDVLVIPTECVNRGNTVYVKGEKDDGDDTAPDGFKTVKVETGLADSTHIEIQSGLSEGDIVRGSEKNADTKAPMPQEGMGNMGAMGGGMGGMGSMHGGMGGMGGMR